MARKKPGDSLRFSAADWNRHEDAADDYERRALGAGGGEKADALTAERIRVKNLSGGDLVRGQILKLDDWPTMGVGGGGGNIPDFHPRTFMFEGSTPTSADDRICVLKDWLKEDEYGWAWIDGVCATRVTYPSGGADYRYCVPAAGSNYLAAVKSGGFPILHKPFGTTGLIVSLVRLAREPAVHHGAQLLSGVVGSPFTTATVAAGAIIAGCGSDALPDNVAGAGTTSTENNGLTALNSGALLCRQAGCYLIGFNGSISYSVTDVPPRGGALQVELAVAATSAGVPGTGTGYRGRRKHNPERDNYGTFTDETNEENIAITGRVNLQVNNVVCAMNSGAYALEVTYGHLWGIRVGPEVS